MKRFLYIALLLLMPMVANSQVAKQVDVEKNYTPSVGKAKKLAMVPDMTDTVMMRPEIGYSFVPRSYETSLLTENFKPAKISYWDFVRKRLLYVKAASGVPLVSEADVYLSSYNKDRGYIMGYVNHSGDYRDRWGMDNVGMVKLTENTSEMSNRIGTRGGLNVGRHILEVDLYGDQQMRHRYPSDGERIRFGEAQGVLRFGDDFTDLSRWNFNVEVGGGLYYNCKKVSEDRDLNQSQLSAKAAVGKMIGNNLLKIHAGFKGIYGSDALDAYKNSIFMAGARYGVQGERFSFLVGADYYHDKVGESSESPHHIFPYMRMTWNNPKQSLVPYVEVDGGLKQHDYGSLSYDNPFLFNSYEVAQQVATLANESVINARAGIGGNLGQGIFAYNLSAQLSIANDHLYWYNVGAYYFFLTAYQHTLILNGSATFRPSGWFEAKVDTNVFVWENYEDYYSNRPNFEFDLALRYTGRKLTIGANLGFMSGVKWMTLADAGGGGVLPSFTATKTDSTFTVGVDAEWRINDHWAVFAEGRNLTGSKVYEWLHYYRDTAQGIAGLKFNF